MKQTKYRVWISILIFALTISLLGNMPILAQGELVTYDVLEDVFPLEETVTITGTTTFPVGSESEPNNRTIFQRLEEETNVHVEWNAISSDQWGEKSALLLSSRDTMTDFIFNADFSDNDLLRYGKQGAILPLEDYIDENMPYLLNVYEKAPEYRTMSTDENGHIWALPWIEQLGSEKTAIQTIGGMSFINKAWLDFLGLDMPTTVDEFEEVLIAFRDNAEELQDEFSIEGDVIPMSCIINDGDQDPAILINGFGEGYGDNDKGIHIAVTDDGEVISTATQEGYKEGIKWLHSLNEQELIDPEAFTHEWATYVAKGKSGRYGVCFSWDVANIATLEGWEPLPALEADVVNITPQTGSFTSGFARGKCVLTTECQDVDLVTSWLDLMYRPTQSPQNNWGTYNEDDDFDIFYIGENDNGDPMLTHSDLGSQSPVEVREAESVGGPLAILDEYYGVYVTLPDDAAYRLNWIEDIYTDDMNLKYCYPNVFMSQEDNQRLAEIGTELNTYINTKRAEWILNGGIEEDWDSYLEELEAYNLSEFLSIYQKYFDAYMEG